MVVVTIQPFAFFQGADFFLGQSFLSAPRSSFKMPPPLPLGGLPPHQASDTPLPLPWAVGFGLWVASPCPETGCCLLKVKY